MTMATILIADDNRSTTETLCTLVERRGHTPFAAFDGAQALTILESETIDVLLTDLRMPHVDGMALLQAVKDR